MYEDYNIQKNELQDKKNGKVVDWRSYKLKSMILADSYGRLGNNKGYSVSKCGDFLEFKKFEDGSMNLHSANFCRVRLCPMCAWRRSKKIFCQVSKVMDNVTSDLSYKYLFLTLTCRNVSGDELCNQLDLLFKSFNALTKRKKFDTCVKGWFRCLEVTHNDNDDTYHPHFHVILAVNKSYFSTKGYYITQDEWVDMWQSCLKCDYKPVVDVRKFKESKRGVGREVSEVAKYAVKPSDYIVLDSAGNVQEDITDNIVKVLDVALSKRRLIAFGGVLKEYHKKLNLDDSIDGDLIHTEVDEGLREDLNYILVRYNWNIGYKNYYIS